MTQIETSSSLVQGTRLIMHSGKQEQNGHASNSSHLTSSSSSSPLINKNISNKIANPMHQQRPTVVIAKPTTTTDTTDFSINLSSIQHAIDNNENQNQHLHSFSNDINEADFSYKNLLSTKIHDQNNGYNSISANSNSNNNKSDANDIKVQVYYCGKSNCLFGYISW